MLLITPIYRLVQCLRLETLHPGQYYLTFFKKSAPLSNSNLLVIGVTDKDKLMYSTVMICIHSINTYTVIHRDVLYRLLSLGIDNKAKTNLFSCYLVGFIDWWC